MIRTFSSDVQLLDTLRRNDTDAFEELFKRHWFSLYQYAFRKLNDEEAALIITRNSFIWLWENRQKISADFSLFAFLYSRIRKEVAAHLYQYICAEEDNIEMVKQISGEFSLTHLKTAYQPVSTERFKTTGNEQDIEIRDELFDYIKKKLLSSWQFGWRFIFHDLPLGFRNTFL